MSGVRAKALPLDQPWASLVAEGEKRVETRGYPPSRMGLSVGDRVVLHANKAPEGMGAFGRREPFKSVLARHGFATSRHESGVSVPYGGLIAVVTIHAAVQMTSHLIAEQSEQELAFGDWAAGRWAWRLTDVVRLTTPIPFRGHQGSPKIPDDTMLRVMRMLGEE